MTESTDFENDFGKPNSHNSGRAVGEYVGGSVSVIGARVGDCVGSDVGVRVVGCAVVGVAEGAYVGSTVGRDGAKVGDLVGAGTVGEEVRRVGARVGYGDGAGETVGIGEDGRRVGTANVGV